MYITSTGVNFQVTTIFDQVTTLNVLISLEVTTFNV